ncbi:MAG: hypothetical protein ISS71_04685 [Phycisphaerae bacterium]|nr:hypothetical protein [Phycisphaerae bacterium]
MITAIVILVMLLTLGYFYLKCTVIGSLSTMMILIIASVLTFSYYEKLAELFISRGHGVQWAHMGCFILIFVLSFALLRSLRDLLVGGSALDLGNPAKISVAVVCGLISGIIVCGNLLVTMGLAPVQSKFFYNRFASDNSISVEKPQKSFLNTDSFITGLYSLISRGSLSAGKSFAVLHADYLSQIHLNRIKIADDILAVTSKKSLMIPSGNTKKPVRIWDAPDKGKVTVVRMGIVAQNIQSGGAINPATPSRIQFCPAQIRMVCKPSSETKYVLTGTGKAIWPIGFYKDGKLTQVKLNDIIPHDVKSARDRIVWLDAVFETPDGYEGVLLEFKQNALVTLPAAVPLTEEIEKILYGEETEADS